MLASNLIRSFISTPAFVRVYCDVFGGDPAALPAAGPPPSRGHAENMGKTLQEWALKLDAAGIQVHQEGAIARFEAAAAADDYGRPPPAAMARKRTAAFYAEVLRRAVATRAAHTFAIPAVSYQGAVVATHEAAVAAAEFFAVDKAVREFSSDPSRPELAAEAEKLRGGLGRAVSMHQTACAEATAAWRTADQGPWFKQVATAEDVPLGQFVVGIEMWAGHQALARCQANLDPQHGGGTYGLGASLPPTGQPGSSVAACDAALHLRKNGLAALPQSARFVTARLDPDALVAAMLLAGRIPLAALHERQEDMICRLARVDACTPNVLGWRPTVRVQTVGDDPEWGPLGALMIPGRKGGPASLDLLEGGVFSVLFDAPGSPELEAERLQHAAQWARIPEIAAKFEVDGPVAHAVDLPFGGGTWAACYSRAPIGVLSSVRPGGSQRAFTVAACGDLGPRGPAFIRAVNARMSAIDGPGAWAGAAGITGSRGQTSLRLADVVAVALACAREAGIVGSTDVRTSVGAPTALR